MITVSSSLTASCRWSCDVPRWPTTNVPRVVSTPWYTRLTYCGNWTTRSSCLLVVLYWCRRPDQYDVTSRRRDVSESVMMNAYVVNSVVSHFTYEWSSHDTRQIPLHSTTYSWRSSRQTTMSHVSIIPSTWMTASSGLHVSVLYRRIVEDSAQTTYMMLSSTVTPRTEPTTNNTSHLTHNSCTVFVCYISDCHISNSKIWHLHNTRLGYLTELLLCTRIQNGPLCKMC